MRAATGGGRQLELMVLSLLDGMCMSVQAFVCECVWDVQRGVCQCVCVCVFLKEDPAAAHWGSSALLPLSPSLSLSLSLSLSRAVSVLHSRPVWKTASRLSLLPKKKKKKKSALRWRGYTLTPLRRETHCME